jgi:hypothetical protein
MECDAAIWYSVRSILAIREMCALRVLVGLLHNVRGQQFSRAWQLHQKVTEIRCTTVVGQLTPTTRS